jgi:hypothetical protein
MSFSVQITSKQLKEIIEDDTNTNKSAREVHEQVEDGSEVVDAANTCTGLSTVPDRIDNEFDDESLDEAVRWRNTHPISHSPDDRIPGCKLSIPGLSGTKSFVYHVWAI